LAGGFNSNIFKIADTLAAKQDSAFITIGKKAVEHFERKGAEIFDSSYPEAADFGVGDAVRLGKKVSDAFSSGEFGSVILVYTKFVSMLTQLPLYEELLPLSKEADAKERDAMYDEDPEELLARIVPEYVGGIIYSTVCESVASESAARRTAMNSANKNAGEIIDSLMLKFNRARQAVITQEITEIVSGADAQG
jgi:F-type H+-transporting ATPase subunit gamma